MSIHNISDKIKRNNPIDKNTVLYFFVIIGVGIGSYGLGRLSIKDNTEINRDINSGITVVENFAEVQNTENPGITTTSLINNTGKRYVASKNGKMYYTLDCSGAKRIKPENEIWFATSFDAEKSGYILSSTCKE